MYIDIRRRNHTSDFKWFVPSPRYLWWMQWVYQHRKNESVYVLLFGHYWEIYIASVGLAKIICDMIFKSCRNIIMIKE